MFWIKILCNFWVRVVSLNVFGERFSQVLEATIYVSNLFQRLCFQLEGSKQDFFGRLLKLHSTCQDEHFDELFSTFEKILPSPFRNLKWRWSAFQQNSSTWSSKLHSTSPNDFLKRFYNIYCPKLFLFCGIWEEFSKLPREKFQAGALKVHSNCSEKSF